MVDVARYRRELSSRWLGLRLALAGRHFQFPEIKALRQVVAAFDVDCIFDVGANQGQYATLLRKDVGFSGTILSFEPNPDALAILRRRAEGDARWHVFDTALSDFDGEAEFNITAAEQFSSLEKPSATDEVFGWRTEVTKTLAVQCRRLEGLFADLQAQYGFTRPFLKMDTQGHDRSVCEGALGIFPQLIGAQSELAFQTLYAGAADYRAAIDWFAARNFLPCALFTNTKGHFPLLVEMDGIFLNGTLIEDGKVKCA